MVTANKQLIAQHGDELFDAAREAGVQLRFEAAVAGVVPVIRVIQESLAATEITKVFGIVNGTTNFILTEMASTGAAYADALAPGPGAGLRRGGPDRGRERRRRRGEDGDPRPARLPLAGRARRRHLRGDRGDPARRHRLREGAGPVAEAARASPSASTAGSASASSPASSTAATRSRPSRGRSTRSWSRRPTITEITMSGPGAGGIETASAVLGDVVSILSGERPGARDARALEIVRDISSSFYLHLEVADRPGVLAQDRRRPRPQRGLGPQRRPAGPRATTPAW